MCGKTGVKQVFMDRKERYTVVDLAKTIIHNGGKVRVNNIIAFLKGVYCDCGTIVDIGCALCVNI